ncbi:MAG: hypothetical protein V8Q54_11780 [Alistipes senegalensis]
MKKIFALLFAALSVAFFACGDEKTDNGNDWFWRLPLRPTARPSS